MNDPNNTWPVVHLEDVVVDMQPGFAQRPNTENIGIPQLRTNNVSQFGGIDLSELINVHVTSGELNKYGVLKGDIIFNNTNSVEWVGKTAYFNLEGNYVVSNHMTRIRVDKSLIDPEFLARYLHYLWQTGFSAHRAKQWVNQAAIDQTTLVRFDVPLPPLPEQQRIIAVLKQVDQLRQLRRVADEKAQTLLLASFYDMFGDPLENERKWPVAKVDEICDLVRGSSPRPQGDPHYFGGSFPRLMVGDITRDGIYVTPKIDSLTEDGAKLSRLMEKGSVVMAVSGSPGVPGLPAILSSDVYIHDGFVGFRNLDRKLNPEFLFGFLLFLQSRNTVRAVGVTFQNLTTDQIKKWEILIPPLALQEDFTSQVRKIWDLKVKWANFHTGLEALFQSLLVQAFSGELTAAWREKHSAEVEQVLLELPQKKLQAPAQKHTDSEALLVLQEQRPDILAAFSKEQRTLLREVLKIKGYFTQETVKANDAFKAFSPHTIRLALHLFSQMGLIHAVRLPDRPMQGVVVYILAYRALAEADQVRELELGMLQKEEQSRELGLDYTEEEEYAS